VAMMSGYAFVWLAAGDNRPGPEAAVEMISELIVHGVMGSPAA
jgi:hypothetical protein